jgi:hypothetical protein
VLSIGKIVAGQASYYLDQANRARWAHMRR